MKSKMLIGVAVAVIGLFAAVQAQAVRVPPDADYNLEIIGDVTGISTFDFYDTNAGPPVPVSEVEAGSEFTYSTGFSSADLTASPVFLNDPTVNVYTFDIANTQLGLPGYAGPNSLFQQQFNDLELLNDNGSEFYIISIRKFFDASTAPFHFSKSDDVYEFFDFNVNNFNPGQSPSKYVNDLTSFSVGYGLGQEIYANLYYQDFTLGYGVNLSLNVQEAVLSTDNVRESAVPEPSTWALMITSLGGIGLKFRSARKAARSGKGRFLRLRPVGG